MPEFNTGDEHLDAVLETGPRFFRAETPEHVRERIAKDPELNWFKIALIQFEQQQRLRMLEQIRQTGIENRTTEWKATDGIGAPYCRIPPDVWNLGKKLCGADCWKDPKFLESFLDDYPECRVVVKRGTRGQEYAGNGR